MANEKNLIRVKGVDLTENVNKVYQYLTSVKVPVNYKEVATGCGITEKSAIGTLARLDTIHGLIKKNEPKKGTFYKVNSEVLGSIDLSKLTDKEKSVIDTFKDLTGEFNYKDLRVNNLPEKALIATLARLNTTYGILEKNTLKNITTYEVVGE